MANRNTLTHFKNSTVLDQSIVDSLEKELDDIYFIIILFQLKISIVREIGMDRYYLYKKFNYLRSAFDCPVIFI